MPVVATAASTRQRAHEGRAVTRVEAARAVVLAIGYYDLPNYLGVPGEDLPHVSHYYTEPHPLLPPAGGHGRRQELGGRGGARAVSRAARTSRSSTAGRRLGDSIKYWVRPDIENRIKEGSIAARFETHVVEIQPTTVVVERQPEAPASGREEIPADARVPADRLQPDVDLMRRAGIRCDDETLAPDLDPETFETNVPNLFIAGGAVAGRNTGSIFIENGRFHGERIINVLAERLRGD